MNHLRNTSSYWGSASQRQLSINNCPIGWLKTHFDFKAVTVDGENALLRDGSLIVWHSESLVDDLMACNFQTAFEQLSFLWKKRGNTLSIS